ncbi:MAG: hypothetical protein R6X27_20080 [Candidatus Desulfacyla sp.]
MPELAVEFIPDFDNNLHMNRFPDKWQGKEAGRIEIETLTATTRIHYVSAIHVRKENNETDRSDQPD